jgi:type II secretory pathway pseudopilin PulG
MTPRTKPLNFPSPSNSRPHRRSGTPGERGVAFLILMMILTILLISLTAALPDIYTQGQREREKELIFRGNEYARAIMLYHRQFNRFPTSVKDLLKKTNGYRFLRHAYRDPMTRSGQWRFIHANAAGVVLDSKTLKPPSVKKPGETSSDGQSPATENSETSGKSSESSESTSTPDSTSTSGSSDNQMKGAFIVGVASTSKHKSIRVWNDHDRYDEWEFLGVGTNVPGAAGATAGAPAASGAGPGNATGAGFGAANSSQPQK